jgi:GNAT superfamily N-acetyltransferase
MPHIRTAFPADIDALIELGRQIIAESPRYSRLQYDEGKVGNALLDLMDSDDGFVRIAIDHVGGIDKPIGMAIAFATEEWFASDKLAQELVLYVTPEYRTTGIAGAMIDSMDRWAHELGVLWSQGGSMTGIQDEAVARLYESRGWVRVGVGLEKVHR